jgi:phenylpropionate dioxygenase-like ring-hydroxylating dioxygenase large terminal subunit
MAHAAGATTSTALAREHYTSDDVFEREIDNVFFRQWTFAAHVSELARPGQFVVVEIATESVIVVRDKAEEIRAFFNVCRRPLHPERESVVRSASTPTSSSWVANSAAR